MARVAIVSPGAAWSEIVGRRGEAWKVRVAAAPERGRANGALVDLLAKTLRVPRESVRVRVGRTGRLKTVEVPALGADEIDRRLAAAATAE